MNKFMKLAIKEAQKCLTLYEDYKKIQDQTMY